MGVTNPQAIKFVNEEVRPLAEQLRAISARIAASKVEWDATIAALFPNDTTTVDDLRDAEGVSRLTGADIQAFVSVAIAMLNAGNTQIISKPCVRALSAS